MKIMTKYATKYVILNSSLHGNNYVSGTKCIERTNSYNIEIMAAKIHGTNE